jgi:hypothetical protein
MGGRVVNLLSLIVVGVIIADALARPAGLKVAVDGVARLWEASMAGLQASAVK